MYTLWEIKLPFPKKINKIVKVGLRNNVEYANLQMLSSCDHLK